MDLDQHPTLSLDFELTTSKRSPSDPERQYPVRANCHRPLRYHDGIVDNKDEHTLGHALN